MTIRWLILIGLALTPRTASCAGAADGWPSLVTPEEKAAAARPAATASLDSMGPMKSPARSSAELDDIRSAVASLKADLNMAMTRWMHQGEALEQALPPEASMSMDSAATTRAQLELSRLNDSAVRFEQLRQRADRLAGDLAREASKGRDVADALDDVGALIDGIEDARAAHLMAVQSSSRRIAQ